MLGLKDLRGASLLSVDASMVSGAALAQRCYVKWPYLQQVRRRLPCPAGHCTLRRLDAAAARSPAPGPQVPRLRGAHPACTAPAARPATAAPGASPP